MVTWSFACRLWGAWAVSGYSLSWGPRVADVLFVKIIPARAVFKLYKNIVSVVSRHHRQVHAGTKRVAEVAVDSRSREIREFMSFHSLASSWTCRCSSAVIWCRQRQTCANVLD